MQEADAVLLVEPRLSPADDWRLISQWASEVSDVVRWVEGLFGCRQDHVEERDYLHLLEASALGTRVERRGGDGSCSSVPANAQLGHAA